MLIWYCLKGQMKLHGGPNLARGPEFDTHDVDKEKKIYVVNYLKEGVLSVVRLIEERTPPESRREHPLNRGENTPWIKESTPPESRREHPLNQGENTPWIKESTPPESRREHPWIKERTPPESRREHPLREHSLNWGENTPWIKERTPPE